MGFAKTEAEIAERLTRFIKAELKRADVTYEELADRLKEHGLEETRNSIAKHDLIEIVRIDNAPKNHPGAL